MICTQESVRSIELQERDFNIKALEIMCEYKNLETQKEKLKPLCLENQNLLNYSFVNPDVKQFIKKYSP